MITRFPYGPRLLIGAVLLLGIFGAQKLFRLAAPAPVPAPVVPITIAAAPTSRPAESTVYVTRTGKKYHRAGCRSLSKSSIPMKLSEARSRGFTACQVCGG